MFRESGHNPELENTIEVETEHAVYRIVYNDHFDGPLDAKTVEGCDGIVLELITVRINPEMAALEVDENNSLYGNIIKAARKNKQPVFFPDIRWKTRADSDDMEKKLLIPFLEMSLGAVLVWNGLQTGDKKVSRRDFIKASLKGVAGAYLMSPQVPTLFRIMEGKEINESSTIRKMEKASENLMQAIHPELDSVAIEGRNDLIAEKSEFISQTLKKNNDKPKVAIVIGASHFGIESSLRMTESERMVELQGKFGKDLKNQSKTVRVDFVDEDAVNLTILEHPTFPK